MKTKIKNYLFRFGLRTKKIIKSITNAPREIYNKIDRGEPKWIKLYKSSFIGIKIEIPFKHHRYQRAKSLYLKSILPEYCNYSSGDYVFIHPHNIPDGSNAIMEVKKMKELLESKGFEKKTRATNDEDSYSIDFFHKIHKNIKMFVYMDEMCDIEYIDVVEQKPIVTGMCAKILEELNTN